jgi:DNA repair protein RadC
MTHTSLFTRNKSGRYAEADKQTICETAAQYVKPIAGQSIRSPNDTHDFLRAKLAHLEHELFCIIYLDNRHRVIAFEELFRGTVDGTSVYPREIVKQALRNNAAAVILAHNHPSGVAEPSQADERITKRVKAALELIDCRMLDHVIIGNDKSTSLASRGML